MLKIIAGIITVLVFAVLVFFNYIGVFKPVNIERTKQKSMWLVYDSFIGPYQDTKPVMDDIYYKLLEEDKVETYRGFGIYYDNPREVKPEDCRSIAGCILEDGDLPKIADLKKKYNLIELTGFETYRCDFPLNSNLSILVGIFRVYPKLAARIEADGGKPGPCMEIYDVPNKTIIYLSAIKPEFPEFDKIQTVISKEP